MSKVDFRGKENLYCQLANLIDDQPKDVQPGRQVEDPWVKILAVLLPRDELINAALLVTVNPQEFPIGGTLGGMYWQREIEERAYALSGSYRAPAQKVGDFHRGIPSTEAGTVQPTYLPGVFWCDLHEVLPEKISRCIAQALPRLDNSLRGFNHPDAVMTAPETRSSSPVRILRDETRQSALRGLYPTGEGAGYAGGIMSAAVDGIQTAEAILTAMKEK